MSDRRPSMEAFLRFRDACAELWTNIVAEVYRLLNRDGHR